MCQREKECRGNRFIHKFDYLHSSGIKRNAPVHNTEETVNMCVRSSLGVMSHRPLCVYVRFFVVARLIINVRVCVCVPISMRGRIFVFGSITTTNGIDLCNAFADTQFSSLRPPNHHHHHPSLFSDLRSLAGTALLSLLASLFMGQLMFVIGVGGVQVRTLSF